MSLLTRRRFLAISAAALCLGGSSPVLGRTPAPRIWRGVALGASAEIRLFLDSDEAAADIIRTCLAEIERLENLFSLFRQSSAISRLNRDGFIEAPDHDFLALLSLAASVHETTQGAFDPTVQPLWEALARAHMDHPDDKDGLAAAVATASKTSGASIGFDRLEISAHRVGFTEPGMALTLNGIAQGYITDRIADILGEHGLDNVLVDMGELRALGSRPDGTPWPVRLSGSGEIVRLRDRALATSSTLGTVFDSSGTAGHIIHPKLREAANTPRQISVEAPTAALADGLSTAFCLMDDRAVDRALAAFSDVQVA